jgi:hypothetical protein
MSPIEGSGRLQRLWVYDDEWQFNVVFACGMFDERLVMSREKCSSIEYHARLPHIATLNSSRGRSSQTDRQTSSKTLKRPRHRYSACREPSAGSKVSIRDAIQQTRPCSSIMSCACRQHE